MMNPNDMPEFGLRRHVMTGSATAANDAAVSTLALLNSQADAVRLELSRLQRDLAIVHVQNGEDYIVNLQHANEKLLVSALDANAVAAVAETALADVLRTAQRDVLTDTPNRALARERLDAAVAMARRRDTVMAVLFVDLDQLKSINDSQGHGVGDAILQLASRRLESAVRSTDTVSRHGGDEFLVVLSELSRAEDAGDIAIEILSALAAPSRIGEHVRGLSASIGIAVFPAHGTTSSMLINAADRAMSAVKRRGGSGFAFFDPALVAGRPGLESGATPQTQTPASTGARSDHQEPLTDLREANERLIIAALTAQELKELSDEAHGQQIKFMAMVAHELRNPLTPIKLAAGMLGFANADAARLAKLQGVIEDQVAHMNRLVEDLLDGRRISTGKLRLHLGQIDLIDILRTPIDICRARAAEKFQQVEVGLPESSVFVRGDKVRLTQVFSNLLDNASKYTPSGGHIAVAVEIRGGDAVITISDDGVGIAPGMLPHIFDLFVQEPGSVSLRNSGLGIGLAVVRELVNAHGGTVAARSRGRNQGSLFTVTLPLMEPASGTASAVSADGETGPH